MVVTCFNYGRYLKEAIESVLQQTWKDFELIVIDGGSTDESREVIEKYSKDPRVRTLLQTVRSSAGENRSAGVRLARGKYCVFLDADDFFDETYLEKAVFLMETSGAVLVSPWLMHFEEDGEERRTTGIWKAAGLQIPEIFGSNQCSPSAMFRLEFLSKHAIEYPADLELEDWEFWCRLASNGATFVALKEPLVWHRRHSESLTNTLLADYDKHLSVITSRWKGLLEDVELIDRLICAQHRPRKIENKFVNLSRAWVGGKASVAVLLTAGDYEEVLEELPFVLQSQGIDLSVDQIILIDLFSPLEPTETLYKSCSWISGRFVFPAYADQQREDLYTYLLESRGLRAVAASQSGVAAAFVEEVRRRDQKVTFIQLPRRVKSCSSLELNRRINSVMGNNPGQLFTVAPQGVLIAEGHARYCWEKLEPVFKSLLPGKSVLDLGSGPGFYSVQAKKLGASRVFANETWPERLRLSMEIFDFLGLDVTPFREDLMPLSGIPLCSTLRHSFDYTLCLNFLSTILDARDRPPMDIGLFVESLAFYSKLGAIILSDSIPVSYRGKIDFWEEFETALSYHFTWVNSLDDTLWSRKFKIYIALEPRGT